MFRLLCPKQAFGIDLIDNWITTSSLPYQVANHSQITNIDNIYILSGATNVVKNSESKTKILNNGLLLPWSIVNISPSIFYHSQILHNNYIYLIGGATFPPVISSNLIYVSSIDASGNINPWITSASFLPKRLQLGAAVEAGGRIYYAGGETKPEGLWNDKIYMAVINPDGSLNPWQEAGTMPALNKFFGLIEHNNHLIILGGENQAGNTDKVFTGLINPDGTISSFTETTPLPQPLRSKIVKVDKTVIAVGGYKNGGVSDKVYYADLNDDGTIGNWSESANLLPVASGSQAVTEANGYLFVTGGWAPSGYLDTVYSAKLNLPTPSPSPSPSPIINPIVLLPGLGGSWNTQAMITGSSGGVWKKTPFVKVYDNLKNTILSISDYVEGNTYFEFYYDWRRPLETLADQLNDYIDSTVLNSKPAETKVNLVGHSMGGMVARTYAQKYGLEKINQVVTTGSPHQGAIKAWMGWSGAEIGDRWSWEWIGLQLYLQIHKGKYASPITAVRDLAPGLSNLMPTFDFAKDKYSQIIPAASMAEFNSSLNNLNLGLTSELKNLLTTISGQEQAADKDTIEWVKLTDRSLTDKLLGKWSDGAPDSYEYTTEGDLTVLLKSALIDGADLATVSASHVELVETLTGIEAILSALGLSVTPVTTTGEVPRNPSLVFFLHSPANFTLTAPDGLPPQNMIISEEDKLAVVYNAVSGNYQVEITGTDSGIYHLEVGRLTENGEVWDQTSNQTIIGQIDRFNVSLDNGIQTISVIQTQDLVKDKLNQLKTEINQSSLSLMKKRNITVYIDQILRLLDRSWDRKTIQTTIGAVYQLRQKIDKFAASKIEWKNNINDIGELLISAFPTATLKEAKLQLNGAKKSLDQVKVIVANKISGENSTIGEALNLAEVLLQTSQNNFNQKNYALAFIQAIASRVVSQEITLMIK